MRLTKPLATSHWKSFPSKPALPLKSTQRLPVLQVSGLMHYLSRLMASSPAAELGARRNLCVFCNDPRFFEIGHSAGRIFCCHVTQ